MKSTVVSRFLDMRTGAFVDPGDPLPKGLDEQRLRRLVRAGCVVAEQGQASGSGKGGKSASGSGSKAAGAKSKPSGSGSAEGLFNTDPGAVDGGAGDAGGGRTEPDAGGSGSDQGQDEGHSG